MQLLPDVWDSKVTRDSEQCFRLVVLLVLGIMLLVLLKLLVLLEVVGIRADKSADRFEKK